MMVRAMQTGFGAAVTVAAAGVLIVEIVAIRLMAPLVGMTIETWSAVIAAVLAGLSLGHWWGGRLAERASAAAGQRVLAWAFIAAAAGSLLPLLLLGPVMALLFAGLGRLGATLAGSLLFFAPPAVAGGIVAPLAARLAIDATPDQRGRILGRLYALGAAGSIAGVLLAGFIMLAWLGSALSLVAVALVFSAMAVVLWAAAGGGRGRMLPALALAMPLAGLAVAMDGVPGSVAGWCDMESRYYCIRVIADETRGPATRLLLLDGLVHSASDTLNPAASAIEPHRFADAVARQAFAGRDDVRVFVLGGGGLTVPDLWRQRYASGRIVAAEIDPVVTATAVAALGVRVAPPLSVVHADGRMALQANSGEPFDIIFADAYGGLTVPPHLTSLEFARLVRLRLTPQGVYVLNLIDDRTEPRFAAAMVRTLGMVFESVAVWTHDGPVISRQQHFNVVAGATAALPDAMADVRAENSDATAGTGWHRMSAEALLAMAPGGPILTDDYAPVDRLVAGRW
ncbi:MAG: fused MFS/spermidine synthase [Alphaproteobacteria bacterium]